MNDTTWAVGYTRTGRSVHAVDSDYRTACGYSAIHYTFGPWAKRDEDMLWCSFCDRAQPERA